MKGSGSSSGLGAKSGGGLFQGRFAPATPMNQASGAKRKHTGIGGAASSANLDEDTLHELLCTNPRLKALAQLGLRTAAEMRTVKSLVTDTFIGEPEENLLKQPKDRGAEYYAEVQRRGKGHKLGSPHKYQVETLLNIIHSDARTAEEEKDIVLTASTEFSHVDQLGKLIPVLRMSQTYERKSRMVIGYSHDAM